MEQEASGSVHIPQFDDDWLIFSETSTYLWLIVYCVRVVLWSDGVVIGAGIYLSCCFDSHVFVAFFTCRFLGESRFSMM